MKFFKHRAVSLLFLLAFSLFALPSAVLANGPRTSLEERMQERFNRLAERVDMQMERLMERHCERFERYQERWGSNLPSFCSTEPDPDPGDPEVSLTFSADVEHINEGMTALLSWSSIGADTCTATEAWSGERSLSGSEEVAPTETSEYTLTCSNDTHSEDHTVTITVVPDTEEPSDDRLLITEVFYDVDDAHGSESANEWVEIYNDSDEARDVSGFSIEDAASADVFPEGTVIPAEGYLVVTNDASTATLWTIPETAETLFLASQLGNGLGNTGDVLYLKDDGGMIQDSVSWGSSVDAFDPAAPDVAEGSSLERITPTTDTDTAADWQENVTPTPGS